MKLGGTHKDNGPGPGQITEKQPFLRLAKECFFGQKSIFSNKKTPEICWKADIHLRKGYFFVCSIIPGHG